MKDYTHTSSTVIEAIESKFTTDVQKKYDVPQLHDLYEQMRYRFQTAEYVYAGMENDHYRLSDILEVLTKEEFIQWYNEMLRVNPPTIEVGMPCTVYYSVYYYSDHRAATVTKVEYYKDGRKDAAGNRIPKLIGTNLNKVKCIDYYAGDYKVFPMTGKDLEIVHDEFTIRKHGRWISKGNETGDGLSLGIGYWDHYIDPSF